MLCVNFYCMLMIYSTLSKELQTTAFEYELRISICANSSVLHNTTWSLTLDILFRCVINSRQLFAFSFLLSLYFIVLFFSHSVEFDKINVHKPNGDKSRDALLMTSHYAFSFQLHRGISQLGRPIPTPKIFISCSWVSFCGCA